MENFPEKITPQEEEYQLTVEQITKLHGEAFAAFQNGDLGTFVDAFKKIRKQYYEEARYLEEREEEKSPRLDFLRSESDAFWGTCRVLYRDRKGNWISRVTNLKVFDALRKVDNSLREGGSEQYLLDQEKRKIVRAAEEIVQEDNSKR